MISHLLLCKIKNWLNNTIQVIIVNFLGKTKPGCFTRANHLLFAFFVVGMLSTPLAELFEFQFFLVVHAFAFGFFGKVIYPFASSALKL